MPELRDLTDQQYSRLKVLDAARWIASVATAQTGGGQTSAVDLFKLRWPKSPHIPAIERMSVPMTLTKATVPALDATGLMLPSEFVAALVAASRPVSVLDRLIPLAVRAPFQTRVIAETVVPGLAAWAAAGGAKIPIAGSLEATTLAPTKVAAITVATEELLKLAAPGADTMLADILARSLSTFVDAQLTDPAVAAVADKSPASITNGLTPVPATADPAADMANLVAAFVGGGGHLESAVVLLSSQNAVALNLSGGDAFRDLTTAGGMMCGMVALASDGIGDRVVLVDAARLLIANDGQGSVDTTKNGAMEMVNPPLQNGAAGTGAALVSLWQNNLVALRLERFVNWDALDGAVAFIDNADYLGAVGSPT